MVEENSAMDVAMDEDELAASYTMEGEDESPPKDSDSMMDYLISAGVDPVTAKHRLNAMIAPKPTATFMEV